MDGALPQKPIAREEEFDFLTSVIGKVNLKDVS